MADVSELIQAIKDGRTEDVARLLETDPALANARAANGESPVMTALYHGRQDLVAELALRGIRYDVHSAAALGEADALEAALAGGHVNDISYDGWTPLHLAAFFGQEEAARQLVDAGAALDAVSTNSMRNTPLHAATAGGQSSIALLLIERGASVGVTDAGGHTPLHIAAENGLTSVVRALLARGADPYAVDREDRTPIARAAAKNRNEIVDLLNLGGQGIKP